MYIHRFHAAVVSLYACVLYCMCYLYNCALRVKKIPHLLTHCLLIWCSSTFKCCFFFYKLQQSAGLTAKLKRQHRREESLSEMHHFASCVCTHHSHSYATVRLWKCWKLPASSYSLFSISIWLTESFYVSSSQVDNDSTFSAWLHKCHCPAAVALLQASV